MKFTQSTALFALAVTAFAFEPNKGPECKLTCRNRVSRASVLYRSQCIDYIKSLTCLTEQEHCPSFHYKDGQMKSCTHSQYGCTDKDLNDCGESVTPPPLCVVNGPCSAGPAGCLEDKTGADDGLPPGEYVGHCPPPKSPMQRCVDCRDGCAMRYPPGGDRFQGCLQTRCRTECYGGLLYKVQYSEAKGRCVQKGLEFGDIEFQTCVKESLDGTIPESYRCLMQYADTESYCIGANYTRGGYEFQGCVETSFDGICSGEFRCAPQFRDARKYCLQKKFTIGGSDFQKCISDQLVDFCPKDVGCKKRHTDAREFCKKEGNGHDFGSPDFQECVGRMLNPSCPKDFNCEQRKSDSKQFCTFKKGLKDGTPEYSECMKEALGEICPGLSSILHPEYEEYAEDL